MTTLPIPVDDDTAAAFLEASEDTREQITQFVASYVQSALQTRDFQTREEKSAALQEAADRLSAQAKANGWNDELDAALLRGDFDHDD